MSTALLISNTLKPGDASVDEVLRVLDGKFQHRFLDPNASISNQLIDVEIVVDWQANPPLEIANFADQIKLWQFLCVGTEKFDFEFWSEKLSIIEECPSFTSGAALGEHALLMMLMLLRRYSAAQDSIELKQLSSPQGEELDGKRILILGFGASGKSLARFLQPFNSEVRALDLRELRTEELKFFGVYPRAYGLADLKNALSWCDIVSIHVPLSSLTRSLIDRQAIAAIRPGGYLINVSRGGIVDEEATAQALESGHLSGAGFDVFEYEPINPQAFLLSQKNLVVTPHIAGNTRQTAIRRAEILRINLVKHKLIRNRE